MRILIVLVIVGLSLFSLGRCGSGDKEKTQTDGTSTETEEPVVLGEQVYMQQCNLCHGSNGDLGASGASFLSQSKLDLQQRIEIITNGRNKMMAYSGLLSEEEIKAVAEYLDTLKK